MKFSQFNNWVHYQGKVVLYNAYSNHFLFVEPMLHDLATAAKDSDDMEGFSQIHPKFHSKLVEKGFIVNKNENEVDKVKAVRQKTDFDESSYHLVINPTMNCNFKCWYCYESHIKDSKMSQETIGHLKQHIYQILQNKPDLQNFHISWFGGEPLLYFDKVIHPLLEYATELCKSMGIRFNSSFTTNGFLINEEMVEIFTRYNILDFQITLDGDRERHNNIRFVNAKRGSYDDILKNIFLLCTSGLQVTLRVNYTKSNIANIGDIAADLHPLEDKFRKNLTISFHKVWQESDLSMDTAFSVNLINTFKAIGFKASVGDVPNNVRNSCYADKKNHATINYNGEVFKCTARNFSSDTKEGLLTDDGTIVWNEKYYKRLDAKFKNKPCLTCSILPICNGGCSQHALENEGKDYCMYDFDEQQKKEIVLSKFISITI